MQLKIIFLLTLLVPFFKVNAQIDSVLVCKVAFKDSKFDNAHAGSGFLLSYNNKIYAITAKHVLFFAKTDSMKTISFGDDLKSWEFISKMDDKKKVLAGELINENTYESITMPPKGDWLIFEVKGEIPKDIVSYSLRDEPLKKNEIVHFLGYPYKAEHPISISGTFVGLTADNNLKLDIPNGNYGGCSGGPVVDKDGKLVGIVSMGYYNQKEQKYIFEPASLDYFKTAIHHNSEKYKNRSFSLSNYLSKIGNQPVRFEVDNITTSDIEYGGSLSLKTQEIVFTRAAPDFSSRSMMLSQFKDGRFTTPEELRIGEIFYDGASDVQLTKDGQYLYFKMPGHIPEDSYRNDGNIWRSRRNGDVWEKAELLPEAINSELSEYYPVITDSGNIYFSRELKETSYDIYVSRLINGEYQEAERLPDYINTDLLESDAYVAPDESYMIFVRMYAEGDLGVSDLYISFNEDGIWSQPKNMRSLNSKGVDGSPFVTSDGSYLFFTSTRGSDQPEKFDGHLDIYTVKFNKEDWR